MSAVLITDGARTRIDELGRSRVLAEKLIVLCERDNASDEEKGED